MLNVKISELELKTPIILASGILGVSQYTLRNVIEAGAGAVTTKSIGPRPRKGYKNPSIFELLPETFINSVGLANPGIDEFVNIISNLKQYKFPLIVSIFGDTEQSYIEVGKKAEQAGCDAIELNISCPHAEVSSIGISPSLTKSLVEKVCKEISIPILIKLNPNVTDITKIALAAEKGGADAVVAINTMAAMAIDINVRRPILSHGSGGLSGRSIHPIAVKKVYDLYKELSIPIIGCGGVFNFEDVVEFFLAGASAVQIGTALYKGVDVIAQINKDLKNYLEKNDYNNISDLTGLAHQYKTQEVSDY
ncbi:MAG: dihydroorotate dehydrogenase [Promethearchaeota archaeon]|nr:MAG: dihydroorotate dehydrogenase [Candidatus Lokiarchaeota archaeon]